MMGGACAGAFMFGESMRAHSHDRRATARHLYSTAWNAKMFTTTVASKAPASATSRLWSSALLGPADRRRSSRQPAFAPGRRRLHDDRSELLWDVRGLGERAYLQHVVRSHPRGAAQGPIDG